MKQIKDNEKIGYITSKGTYYKIWRRGNYLFCIVEKAIKQSEEGYKLVEVIKPAKKEIYREFKLV